MGICIHASILLQSPTSAPHSIPCRIHTYIYYAVTATIPFFVWLELAQLLPSLPSSPMKTSRKKNTRTEGRKDGRRPSLISRLGAAGRGGGGGGCGSVTKRSSPSFLPLPRFLVPPSSLPYISLSRYAISPYSHSERYVPPPRRTPSLSRLPSSHPFLHSNAVPWGHCSTRHGLQTRAHQIQLNLFLCCVSK